jgi:CheY-like chemotaxis protein
MFGRFSVWILELIAGGPEELVAVVTDGLWTVAHDHAPAGSPVSGCEPLRGWIRPDQRHEMASTGCRNSLIASVSPGVDLGPRLGRVVLRRDAAAAGTSITGVTNPVLLVYSHRPEVRERIMTAIGRRPAPDVGRVDYLECSAVYEVMMATQSRAADVLILDGEAQPTGGIGISRQIHQEAAVVPPVVIVVRREDDRWLATWAGADEILVHPLDPVTAADSIARLLRRRAAGLVPSVTDAPPR